MGTRAHYSIGDKDGIENTVFENLPSLIRCLDHCREQYPEEYDDALFRKTVYMNEVGSASLTVDSSDQANEIDRVVDELLFYDVEPVDGVDYELFRPIDHFEMRWRRYPVDLREVLPSSSDFACTLYKRLLIDGMSIAKYRGHKYQVVDGDNRVAWALPHEIDRLVPELQSIREMGHTSFDKQHGVRVLLQSLLEAREAGGSLIVQVY